MGKGEEVEAGGLGGRGGGSGDGGGRGTRQLGISCVG